MDCLDNLIWNLFIYPKKNIYNTIQTNNLFQTNILFPYNIHKDRAVVVVIIQQQPAMDTLQTLSFGAFSLFFFLFLFLFRFRTRITHKLPHVPGIIIIFYIYIHVHFFV